MKVTSPQGSVHKGQPKRLPINATWTACSTPRRAGRGVAANAALAQQAGARVPTGPVWEAEKQSWNENSLRGACCWGCRGRTRACSPGTEEEGHLGPCVEARPICHESGQHSPQDHLPLCPSSPGAGSPSVTDPKCQVL